MLITLIVEIMVVETILVEIMVNHKLNFNNLIVREVVIELSYECSSPLCNFEV